MRFSSHDRRVLSHQKFEDQIVSGDFRNGVAVQSTFQKVHFRDAKMDAFNFTNSVFLDCSFIGCSLVLAGFNASAMKNVVFTGCNLDQARFQLTDLDHVSIAGGRAEYADFSDSSVSDLKLETQLHGADLSFIRAVRLDLSGSNLWGAKIRADCAFFNGTTFDRRSVALFLSLLASSEGNAFLTDLTTGEERELAARLIRRRED